MIAEGVLRCTTGPHHFALRAGDVVHVSRADQMRADDSRDGRSGVVKLGGQHVPVFCLRQTLGLPDCDAIPNSDRYIAVTGDQHELLGWLVDRVTREPNAAMLKLAPLPPSIGGTARHWFEAVANSSDGGAMLLINPMRLNPLRADRGERVDGTTPFVAPPVPTRQPAAPVALVFSTPALPSCDIDKFVLSGRQVAAIVHATEPVAVPGCARHVSGVTLWRDVVVPIVDFRDASRIDAPNQRRLIARCTANGGRSLVAMTIDADVVMHRPAADNRFVSGAGCPSFVSGVFELNGDRVALLDLDAVMSGAA